MQISIITVTYNNLAELKNTLNSLPNSDIIESVVINGGDSEETMEYLKKHRGKVINQKDDGIADAFNKGIKHSNGKLVMFLNSGDILIDKSYPEQASKLFERDEEISFIHSNIIFEDQYGGNIIIKPIMRNLGRGMPYLHPSMIIKREVFNKVGEFNTHYEIAMDFDLIVRMEINGYKGYYLDIPPVVKMEGTGKSQTRELKSIIECLKSLKENNYLTPRNLTGITVRTILFFLRFVILFVGGGQIMKVLKQKKYTSVT